MADYYTSVAFDIGMTNGEADLFVECFETAASLWQDTDPDARVALWDDASEAFRATFPAKNGEDPFTEFLELFCDMNFPTFDCDIERAGRGDHALIFVHGDQAAVDAIGALIRKVAKSALPFGFVWSSHCSRHRPDGFGGGYLIITEAGIGGACVDELLERALLRETDDGADGVVLASNSPDGETLYWNAKRGFGPLSDADVLREREASTFDVPIADDEPEWVAVPRALERTWRAG